LLSGKSEVFHTVLPILAVTRIEPQALRGASLAIRICIDALRGTRAKYHAALPW